MRLRGGGLVSIASFVFLAAACTEFGTTATSAPPPTGVDGVDGGSSPNDGAPNGEPGDGATPQLVDGASASAYASAVRADQPLAYWRLEETTGATAVDEMGAHDGTWIGTPTLGVSGPGVARGRAAKFARNIRLVCGAIAFLGDRPAYTIEFWINAPSNEFSWVFQNQQWFPKREGVSIFVGSDLSLLTERYFDGRQTMYAGNNVPSNVWAHVAVVYESAKKNLVYVNASPKSAPLEVSAQSLNPASAVEWGGGAFAGFLDELAIYDHALPQERVSAHYLAGR